MKSDGTFISQWRQVELDTVAVRHTRRDDVVTSAKMAPVASFTNTFRTVSSSLSSDDVSKRATTPITSAIGLAACAASVVLALALAVEGPVGCVSIEIVIDFRCDNPVDIGLS